MHRHHQGVSLYTEVTNSSKKHRNRDKLITLLRISAIVVLYILLSHCDSFVGFGSSVDIDSDIDDCTIKPLHETGICCAPILIKKTLRYVTSLLYKTM
jgi:hypothetical protein